jgi:hypothetical protein
VKIVFAIIAARAVRTAAARGDVHSIDVRSHATSVPLKSAAAPRAITPKARHIVGKKRASSFREIAARDQLAEPRSLVVNRELATKYTAVASVRLIPIRPAAAGRRS